MKIKYSKIKLINWGLLVALLASLLLGYETLIDSVSAQSGDIWTTPVNLSRSGSTSNPIIVTDADGMIHVIWFDQFNGYMHSESADQVIWTQPVSMNFPFLDFQPRLIADVDQYVYAFWQDTTGALFSSKVANSQFSSSSAWESAQLLAQNALAYDVALGEDGALHLAYLRPLDTFDAPAGVYYRQISANRGVWTASQPIQTSLYLRGMNVADAHIRIAGGLVAGTDNVFITWDERPLRKVHLLRSRDGGDNWDDPFEVDRPNVESGFATPFDLDVEVWSNSILLIWKIGDPLGSCAHPYQFSLDGGETWSTKSQVFEGTFGCSTQNNFFSKQADMLFWLANLNGQITFLAWNGELWSDPQVQTDLASIENPLTFENISLACLQLAEQPHLDQILAAGCEQNQNGDIWFTSRELGELADWFPSPSAWSQPEELFDISVSQDSLELIGDLSGNFHAFWVQLADDTIPTSGSSIFYARWDGANWTMPVTILSSPDGKAANPSITLGDDGRLYVAWSAGEIGELFFSWAQAERAFNPSEWSQPVGLPVPSPAASSPDLMLDPSGEIIVAYAIPLNEARGIYIVRSVDTGVTWSAPELVFDAALAGWNVVQAPHILVPPEGGPHLLWQQQPYPGDTDPQVLFYSHFMGNTTTAEYTGLARGWSVPLQVDEGLIPWSRFAPSPSGGMHRLWFNAAQSDSSLYQQYSGDEGGSWSVANILGNFGEEVDAVDGFEDQSGRYHLIQAVSGSSQGKMIRYWSDEAERLVLQAEIPLPIGDAASSISDIAIAVNSAGRLQVVYKVTETDRMNATRSYFAGMYRTIELEISGNATTPPAQQTPDPTFTPDAAAPPFGEATVEPTFEPTPTISLADLPVPESGPLPGNLVGIVSLSAVIAGGLLGFILLFRANPLRNLLELLIRNGKAKK
jgi:hypothetical protein